MPELPEVQTTVDGINERAKGLVIRDVWTDYKSPSYAGKDEIKNPAYFRKFKRSIIGAKIVRASRRAKNVLIHLSNGKIVLIHMKMTGHILYGRYAFAKGAWKPADEKGALNDPFNRFIHLVFSLSNGDHLALSDMRKFAKATLVDEATIDESEHLKKIGPEPLDTSFGVAELVAAVSKRPKGAIKSVLMDHTIVAGIGNIYSDEILWRAGIHPLERIENIPKSAWPTVLGAIKKVLARGLDFGGDSMSDYRNIRGERGAFQEKHEAYRGTGKRCGKKGCSGTIVRIKVGGRSAHFCDKHQKLQY